MSLRRFSNSCPLARAMLCVFLSATMTAGPAASVMADHTVSGSQVNAPAPLTGEELPVEERDRLLLGFAEFSAETVPAEYRYLAQSIPLKLSEELADIPERVRTPEEIRGFALELRDAREVDLSESIASRVEERDTLIFASPGTDRGAERSRIDEELTALRSELARLRVTPVEAIMAGMSPRLPLEIAGTEAESSLFPSDFPSDGDTSGGSDTDYLIGGSLEWDDEYLIVRVSLMFRSTQERVQIARTIARPEDALEDIDALLPQIVAALLNRPFARLDIVANEPSASLTVDGELVGFGSTALRYLEPGRYSVRAAAAGFRDAERQVTLLDGQRLDVELELGELDRISVRIDSDPQGADLYIGSEWAGRTPLTIDRPIGPRSAELRLEDYHPSRFVLQPRGGDELSRRLAPAEIDLSRELRDRREGFYRSLGWFAVSVPIPLILSGVWQNRADFYTTQGETLSAGEQQRFLRDTAIIDGLRWGGVAFSGGLLINSIVQAVRYIRASRYYHFE